MKKIIVNFCIDADVIEVPNYVADNLKETQNQFLEWLFNKENDHSYWQYKDGKKYGCSYRSEAYVEWLNLFIIKDFKEKARVLEYDVEKLDDDTPTMNF